MIPLQTLNAKRKWIFVAALLLCSFLLALRFAGPSNRDLALGFVGFTNSGTQSHALFWMTNRTSPELWWFHHASLQIGDNWREDGSNYPQLLFFDYYGPPETRDVVRLVGVPVSATNVPLRVVFECLEQIPIRDKVEEFYQQRIRKRSVYVASGRHYFVTNEVPPNIYQARGGNSQKSL